MIPVQIPYLYNINADDDYDNYFTINSLNNGFTLCKKLGFTPTKIILGKKEEKELQCWHPSNDPVTIGKLFEAKIIFSEKESELSFYCDKIFKINGPVA